MSRERDTKPFTHALVMYVHPGDGFRSEDIHSSEMR